MPLKQIMNMPISGNSKQQPKQTAIQYNSGEMAKIAIHRCSTCDYWIKGDIPENSMPLCIELQYWICVKGATHSTSNFGCTRHSALNS